MSGTVASMDKTLPSVSVLVPVRNEAGTIQALFSRLPVMGRTTEVIVVEGGSTDDTWDVLQKTAPLFSQKFTIQIVKQQGKGKADAVYAALKQATGDITMILDGDLGVDPETLPSFLQMLLDQKGDFINGSRFLLPMQRGAMQWLNHKANQAFAFILSFLLGQRITDSLCGTKVLHTKNFDLIAAERHVGLDPYGDFDLLFGAAGLGLKIAENPVHYRRRVYGRTNIRRFRDGLKLLKIVCAQALIHRKKIIHGK